LCQHDLQTIRRAFSDLQIHITTRKPTHPLDETDAPLSASGKSKKRVTLKLANLRTSFETHAPWPHQKAQNEPHDLHREITPWAQALRLMHTASTTLCRLDPKRQITVHIEPVQRKPQGLWVKRVRIRLPALVGRPHEQLSFQTHTALKSLEPVPAHAELHRLIADLVWEIIDNGRTCVGLFEHY